MLVQADQRVAHPKWGLGTVITKRAFGLVKVRFDEAPSLPRTVSRAELHLPGARPVESEAPPAPETEPEAASAPTVSPVSTPPRERDESAWQTLEALRLGVPPARGVKDYTVARDREIAALTRLLDDGRGCRIIWGDYGAGKTHLLDAAEQLALADGFATARITLDPAANALHHPVRLYRSITDVLRTNDSTSDAFHALFDRLVDHADLRHPGGKRFSRFLSPYLHALKYGDEEQAGWLFDYVRGDNMDAGDVSRILFGLGWRGERLLQMSDFRTYGRMYVHLVGTLATWCREAGYRGLVLLFDEVERVDALDAQEQGYAFEVLKHYAAATIEPEHLAFDPEDLYRGGKPVHRQLPLRFAEDQPLTTVFALTPLEEVVSQIEGITSVEHYNIHLGPLGRANVPGLVARVVSLYMRAYQGFGVTEHQQQELCSKVEDLLMEGQDSFRASVRGLVLQLDGYRVNGSRA